jgi:hypothetical protein
MTAVRLAVPAAIASSLPALIARAGDRAALRFLEYFTVSIRNHNTRTSYARAAVDFLGWCEGRGLGGVHTGLRNCINNPSSAICF